MSMLSWITNTAHLSSKPSLTQDLLFELWVKEIEYFLQLTLYFILVVFESLGCVILFVNAGVEDVLPRTNPRSIQKKELVARLVYEVFVSAVGSEGRDFFIFGISRWGCTVDPSTLGDMGRVVVVVGDVCKLAVETVHFSLRRVLLNFILPGNLQNAIT